MTLIRVGNRFYWSLPDDVRELTEKEMEPIRKKFRRNKKTIEKEDKLKKERKKSKK